MNDEGNMDENMENEGEISKKKDENDKSKGLEK